MINWKVRYSKIIEKNPDLFDETVSILEVGSGNFGISAILKRKVFALEPEFTGPVGEWLMPVTGSVLHSGFTDRLFDYVVCVDVLEHLSKEDRHLALQEMTRIAKKKVLLSFPCGGIAQWGDQNYASQLKSFGFPLPGWLNEHLANGFPSVQSVATSIKQLGYEVELIANEGMMQHYGGVLLDSFFGASAQMLSVHANKVTHESPILESEWDLYYSFLFSIDVNPMPKANGLAPSPVPPQLSDSSDVKIYAAYHAPIPLDHFSDITPLAVGPMSKGLEDTGRITDRLGDGSALNNERWSELSGIYKIWKEAPSAYVGFCHYRRIFDLRPGATIAERFSRISLAQFPQMAAAYNDTLQPLLAQDTLLLPKPEIVEGSLFDQYHMNHNINDLCLTLKILNREFPELSDAAQTIFHSNELYANNMFITNWTNFDEICQIWFKVLTAFEEQKPVPNANRYQRRDISFLAERIFTIWVNYKKSQGATIRSIPFFHIDYPELDNSSWTLNG